MRNIIRTLLFTVLLLAIFKGISTGQWGSSIIVVIVSSVLLLVTFISGKASQGRSAYTSTDSSIYASNNSHSNNDCGGDSGGCD
ncbi:hypothetical protein [uncultured Pseudoalteromonas sp.]|uniref:hypothetical protein n=1 Tax=uncultured Pseudoalteromonas sp. TaxID=114053 RepID=UPI002599FA7A|nr:hypothetical protein [uncultured Pseudoalteromonas sp.]